ncbi:putative glucooligosaccharide oxidase [Hypoxylon crocopeplum]|nr:putative glucooligosaccharide oxidase [Hypoxylon crocopeplum]
MATNTSSLIKQLVSANIPFKTSADPDWASYSSTYNLHLPVSPAVVIVPTTTKHICEAVIYARQYGVKVQARSGGHSYSSYSSGGVDGTMIIDLKELRSIDCSDSDTATVSSGVRLGNLALAIYRQKGRALSHGTCAGVGIGGHFTHGGYGLFSRAWGLAMDQIVGMDVVTADGLCVHADEVDNDDLYYAMRGAADSFGIVTTFYLKTQPAPTSVINWRVEISGVTKSVESAVNAFRRIQDFTHNESIVDRQLGFNVALASDYFAIKGTYLGPCDTFVNVIMPELLEGISEGASVDMQQTGWLETLKLVNQGRDLDVPPEHSEHSNFFAKSVVVPEPGLTNEALTGFFTYLLNEGKQAPVPYFILIDLYGGADSQINNKDLDFSAFAHRDALWVAQLYGYVGDDEVFPQEGLDFVNGLANAMTTHLPKYGAYYNYTDPSLTREEAHKLYYGDELHKRLKVLKEKWDPDNVFANPQSI